MGMYSRGICILCDSMQGLFVFAAVCLAAVVAVPRVRHEDRWHPSPPRDISQYRPRGDMFPMDAATAAAMPNRPPARGPPSPNPFTILLKSVVLRAPLLRTKLSAVTKQLHTSTPGLSLCSLTTPGSVAAR